MLNRPFSAVHVKLLIVIINAIHLQVMCLNVSGKRAIFLQCLICQYNFENYLFTFKPYQQQSNDTVTVSCYGSFVVTITLLLLHGVY